MAKHTITVIHTTVGGKSKIQKKEKKTTAKGKTSKGGVSDRNKPMTLSYKDFPFLKSFIPGAITAVGSIKLAKAAIDVFSTIGDAATGNSLYYNNIKSKANLVLDPLGSIKEIALQSIVGNLRIQRENISLEYQRQLTGSLAFSRKTSNGTF